MCLFCFSLFLLLFGLDLFHSPQLERDNVTGEHVKVPMETSTPQLYNQGDGLFYVTSGPLAASLGQNFTKPLKDFVGNAEEPSVVKVSDKQWGKKFRHVEVVYI